MLLQTVCARQGPQGNRNIRLECRIQDREFGCVVSMAGDLTGETIGILKGTLKAVLARHSTVILDLSALSRIDSAGLDALYEYGNPRRGTQRRVLLIGLAGTVKKLADTTSLSRRVRVFPTEADAVASLKRGPDHRPPRKQ